MSFELIELITSSFETCLFVARISFGGAGFAIGFCSSGTVV